MTKRGALIVIEGTDGSGKATQTKMLVERLNCEGILTSHMGFPRYYTPTGRIISQCYLGKKRGPEEGDIAWFGDADSVNPLLASLYYASDRYAAIPDMLKILNSGTHLVLDRYRNANKAHQGGKIRDKRERQKFFEDLDRLELEILRIPKEDKTVFLYMPWEVALKLREQRGEDEDGHESNLGHLIRAEEVYLDLAHDNEWEQISCSPDRTINSLRTPEDIGEEVYGIIRSFI